MYIFFSSMTSHLLSLLVLFSKQGHALCLCKHSAFWHQTAPTPNFPSTFLRLDSLQCALSLFLLAVSYYSTPSCTLSLHLQTPSTAPRSLIKSHQWHPIGVIPVLPLSTSQPCNADGRKCKVITTLFPKSNQKKILPNRMFQ